jgi:hypothetical protein
MCGKIRHSGFIIAHVKAPIEIGAAHERKLFVLLAAVKLKYPY